MFRERLKKCRTSKGYSQQQMADFLGITRQGYGKYETGKAEPDLTTLTKLSNILGVSTDFLLKGTHAQFDLDEILSDPETLIAGHNGTISKEKAKVLLYYLLKNEFDKQ
ncbi:XRE family transcriptional regulator [Bacillus atrophaeus]|uniref:Transcriptional regulator (Xre family) phage SPbeta n=1 Tax=Bacillus atrophaeus (strain 1942) TaxID=720555 RepID=A0ABM5LXE0_BACA1|nr:helix-turn-helix transcriptional regulator [Bacillus atrophaeus]AMR62645.1 transcriptional regulator [Bacillus subtilis subsp. globigii]ADP32506.1 putative transcriptional regulator (Xre family); phage SPbeta [Bacillus atrophaeus 1942]AIK47514.1 helix-turn-helix family protein [Bacillus atrophaeus subsp. globigii]EIM11696.1 putative Xre family transcriptional regulator [Bacillus atrophaeus C89]KFK83182.1 helix-turn-helix family protein [Bacillus atrophaeus]